MYRFLFTFLLLALPAAAQSKKAEVDKPGSQDHPLFTRMPNFYISTYQTAEFDSGRFRVKKGFETVEGRKFRIHYKLKTGMEAPSRLEIQRNYEQAIRKIGGEVLYVDPGITATFRLARNNAEIWVDINSYGRTYDLLIVERGQMVQKVTANAMLDSLNKDGFIALDIQFDTGQATIKPESEALLQEILALLKTNPALKLSIEGHTDNTGTAEGNRTLSEARAKAVLAWLTAQGVEAGRLASKGFGQDRPVADNRTEEGRAKNRRVELVKL